MFCYGKTVKVGQKAIRALRLFIFLNGGVAYPCDGRERRQQRAASAACVVHWQTYDSAIGGKFAWAWLTV